MPFLDADLVVKAPHRTMWRRGDAMQVKLDGVVTDDISLAWQVDAQKSFDAFGYPRVFGLDNSECEPDTSMQSRFRAASFCRESLRHVKAGLILTGSKPGPLVVTRTILKVIGMPNVHVYSEAHAFARAMEDALAGRAFST